MKKIQLTPKNRRVFQNGAYASVLTAVVLVLVILLNLVAGALPTTLTEFDISMSGMFTLSETSRTILDDLSQPVKAYYVAQSGQEDTNVTRLLDRYADAGSRFSWEQKDPVLYPSFTQQYDGASAGSVILTSGDRYEVVGYNDMYEMDLEAYYYYGTQEYSFKAENALTNALAKVLRTESYLLYELTGHGETALESDYTDTLESAGVTVQELNLLSAGSIPQDAAAVLCNAPLTDLTAAEAKTLTEYLTAGGRLLITTALDAETPNLDSVLAAAGLSRQTGLLIETDGNYYAYGYPATYLMPEVHSNDVTAGMANGIYVFAPISQGILTDEETDFTHTSLLSTSSSAYAMQDYAAAQTAQKGENDPEGSFDLAVAAEDTVTGARLVWVNCPNVFLVQMNQAVSGGNAQFMGSVANWLVGGENLAVIEARSMSAESLTVPGGAIVGFGLLFTIVLPLACLILGIVVCVLRRRR